MAKKIRVLHIVVRMDVGGIETWLVNLLRNYDKSRFQMDVCEIGRRGIVGKLIPRAVECGSEVFNLPLNNLFTFKDGIKSLASKYDVVVSHTAHYLSLYLFLTIYNLPSSKVLYLHSTGHLFGNVAIPFAILNSLIADKIIGVSKQVIKKWVFLPQLTSKSVVIPLGVDAEKFNMNFVSAEDIVRLKGEKFVIGHIGRFTPEKNHQQFVRVAQKILERRNDILFVLVGDGSTKQHITDIIKQNKMLDHVIFTGIRFDIPNILKTFDLVFYPSHYEGFPVSFIEAQVMGVPVVTGNRGELREAICPENHPWCIVNTHNVDNCVDALEFIIDNRQIRTEIGNRGRQWALSKFTIRTSVDQFQDVFDSLIEHS